jgi:hypothetical protein
MVTRKRARQRTGRLDRYSNMYVFFFLTISRFRRDGNVWVYRVAPAFLTSIFEMAI